MARPEQTTDTNTLDFVHKKSLGQNFLTSDYVPNLMCEAGQVTLGDRVIEIGPGTGALTKVLLERGALITAIETDERAIAVLSESFKDQLHQGQLQLIHGDMREFSLTDVTKDWPKYKVIANIPYYLSGFLLRTVLELPHPPSDLVFLMQKEVVHRICRDKKSSLLGLSVRVYGEPVYVKTVSKGHFNPPPKVDSAILLVKDISHKHLPSERDRETFFTLLHEGLGSKRKQLRGLLRQHYDESVVANVFTELNLKDTIRGEDLPLDTWLALSRALTNTR